MFKGYHTHFRASWGTAKILQNGSKYFPFCRFVKKLGIQTVRKWERTK